MITKERVGAYIIALADAQLVAAAATRDAQNANANLARELEISRQLAAYVRELKRALDQAGEAVCSESACYLDAVAKLGDADAEIEGLRRVVRWLTYAVAAIGASAVVCAWLL